jgi:hypothetical protein
MDPTPPPSSALDRARVTAHVAGAWDRDIVKVLHDYIRIPNVSAAYDPGWAEAGHMDRAVELLRDWCLRQREGELDDAVVEVSDLPERSPLLVVDIPARGLPAGAPADTVLLYGHPTAAAPATTATRSSPPSPRSPRCGPPAAPTTAASC